MVGAGAALAGAAVGGWLPTGLVTPAGAEGRPGAGPPGFPAGLPLYKRRYENWSREVRVDDVWTCAPTTPADVVTVANWAAGAGYQVRPRGYMHNWTPCTLTPDQTGASPVVLLDTTQHLTAMRMAAGSPAAVTVQTGATMASLLAFLEAQDKGLMCVPAIGEITVGGALAIDGHGAAVPAVGETAPAGGSFGTVSNLVLALTAVVWDPARRRYELRTFDRSHPDTAALLTHLGRAFLTEVTIQVAPLQHLRCQSWTNIPNATLFAPPARAGRQSFASFLDRAGRVEAILYPFAPKPWLKVWSVEPTKPRASRRTTGPNNYAFSDSLPVVASDLAARIIRGEGSATPLFGDAQYEITATGLTAMLAADLWGPAKDTQHYIRASTLRLGASGGLVVLPRSEIQRAVSEFHAKVTSRLADHRAHGRYPINGPVEIRASGIDRAADVLVPGAEPPMLSAVRERADRPEWDTALWINMLTFPGTPFADEFYVEMEAWARHNYASYASPRQEWTKGWAYTSAGAWTDDEALRHTIPGGFLDWDRARQRFNALDPHRIFSNPLLDRLLP
jgi:FAD/FMN-containing dehydrogenase